MHSDYATPAKTAILILTPMTAEWTAQQLRDAFPWDTATTLSAAGSRSDLRRRIHEAGQGYGYQGSPFGPAITLAASVHRTPDRHSPPGVSGPRDCLQRGLAISAREVVPGVLSRIPDAPLAG